MDAKAEAVDAKAEAEADVGRERDAEAAEPEGGASRGGNAREEQRSSRAPSAVRASVIRQPSLLSDELAAAGEGGREEEGPPFTVRCLGRFEVEANGSPVPSWEREKAGELLAYLIVRGSASVPRDEVADALWPEIPWDASLDHTLANVASSLRATLREAAGARQLRVMTTSRAGGYQLKAHLFRVDLDAFEAALRRGVTLPDREALEAYEQAFGLYRGDFLEGQLSLWAETYRRDYRGRLLDGARRAAEAAERAGEPERALAACRLVLEREPTDEATTRHLMTLLAGTGDINGVRKAYKALAEALQREFGDPRAAPGPETRALLAELVAEVQSA